MKNFTFILALIFLISCNNRERITDSNELNLSYSNSVDSLINSLPNNADTSILIRYSSGLPKIGLKFKNGELTLGPHAEFYNDSIQYAFRNEIDTFIMTRPIIKNYYFVDPSGKLIYKRIYDSDGDPIKSMGKLIFATRIFNNPVSVGDTTSIQIYIINEPYPARYYDLQRKLILKVYQDNKLIRTDTPNINEEYSCYFIEETFVEPGEYFYRGIVEFKDVQYDTSKSVKRCMIQRNLEFK